MTTRELSVELEVVTPLFLGGADQDTPEARAASFRGALRFWWRALAAEPNLAELRRREAEIFGDTTCASSVRVDVEVVGPIRRVGWNEAAQMPPPRLDFNAQQGLSYVAFALRGTRQRAERVCLPAGTRLRLVLHLRRGADEDALRQAAAALWLLINLGGLGTRARRGLGDLAATSAATVEGLPPWRPIGESPAALARHLSEGLAQLRTLIDLPAAPNQSVGYPILTRRHAWVVVLARPWPSWQAAVGNVARLMSEFRRPLYPRMTDLRSAGISERAPDRAVFGLPIQYYHPKTQEQYVLAPTSAGRGDAPERRASPLLIKIVPIGQREYAAALTVFHGFGQEFLPVGVDGLRGNGVTFPTTVQAKPLGDFLTRLADTSQQVRPDWPGSPGLLPVTLP